MQSKICLCNEKPNNCQVGDFILEYTVGNAILRCIALRKITKVCIFLCLYPRSRFHSKIAVSDILPAFERFMYLFACLTLNSTI